MTFEPDLRSSAARAAILMVGDSWIRATRLVKTIILPEFTRAKFRSLRSQKQAVRDL
jgi:hypothetical protein